MYRRRRFRRRSGRKRFRPGYNRTSGYYGRFNRKRRRYNPKIEKKFFDHTLNDASIAATGEYVALVNSGGSAFANSLVGIDQGTGEQQRIGRKCTITDIYMRLNFEFLPTVTEPAATIALGLVQASIAHETITVCVFIDKQANGAGAGVTQLVEADTYNSFRNLANNKRFKILHRRTYAWNTRAIAAANGITANEFGSARIVSDYQINIRKKMFLPIEFDSTAGALTEIRSNNILMLIWAKHGARMKLDPTSRCRIRFIDF